MTDKRIKRADAARALGVSHVTIFSWLAKRTRPRIEHRQAIALWTNGAVPVESWATQKELGAVLGVRPFNAA